MIVEIFNAENDNEVELLWFFSTTEASNLIANSAAAINLNNKRIQIQFQLFKIAISKLTLQK